MHDLNWPAVADFIGSQPPSPIPYRLLTEVSGVAYRHSLEEVVSIVCSQLMDGKVVVVIPPEL